ncbi:phosphotransferase enzyme family protein [Liquorilactobacillus ghanensis DSM 18630]|uniref:Phosphotransferase enzyme family protein n=2 Tax=Liquorilactobacillus ghanensis TaxID=399370 RepID=A0A0R1VJA0_9LACO|nr:phosphotransferase enzyme family protein [Liquorilactobacillus ghanensis DSM 18630]
MEVLTKGSDLMDEKWLTQLPIKEITSCQRVGGGDVNQAYHLKTKIKDYFLLVQPQQPQSFYQGEIAGLQDFQRAGILAPRVVASGRIQGDAYLLLNYLATQRTGNQQQLGALVAKLHQTASPNGKFGYDYPYAGTSIAFDNAWTADWVDLFVKRRLDKLAQQLKQDRMWGKHESQLYTAARSIIIAALTAHSSQPVLLHGDLWAGNFVFLTDGRPALIDPAALYGDREFDLGITTVFGGFTADFYSGYQQVLPLDQGYQQRLSFYQLYYLMVHLNKFGSSYAASVQHLLEKITSNK